MPLCATNGKFVPSARTGCNRQYRQEFSKILMVYPLTETYLAGEVLIRMEATYPESGKPFYTAHTSIDALAIVDNPSYSESYQKVRIRCDGGHGWNVFEPFRNCVAKSNFNEHQQATAALY